MLGNTLYTLYLYISPCDGEEGFKRKAGENNSDRNMSTKRKIELRVDFP